MMTVPGFATVAISMITPNSNVDEHTYAGNVEEQIIQLTNVKTIPSVLIVMVIALREAENLNLNKERERSRKFEQKKK